MLARKQDPALQLGLFVGSRESYAFAVRKEDTRLLRALNEHVTNLRRSASWHLLVTKHYGEMAMDVLSQLASPD